MPSGWWTSCASRRTASPGGQDLSRRIPVNGERDELYHLAGTLNRMFDRLEDSFQAEQQFISDVSHELRTPTAVILAECQYALGAEQAEQTAALEVIQRQGKRMSRMTEEMLTLSRMEQGQDPSWHGRRLT